jgi:hypothetical protein
MIEFTMQKSSAALAILMTTLTDAVGDKSIEETKDFRESIIVFVYLID